MERIGSYDAYRTGYYDSTVKNKRDAESAKKTGARETGTSQDRVSLSSAAKNLLKELKRTHGNMDFIVADFESDEEAASYLSRGTGEYSVLISPDELEEMAADENVKNENLAKLDEAVSMLGDMKDRLGDKKDEITRLGVAIGDDGEISYFAELEKMSERQRERIEKQRADKKEAAAEAKKAEGAAYAGAGTKRTTVFADSVEELSKKIDQVDWSKIKEEQAETGNRFNLTV